MITQITETVRALSWKEPFASLMLQGKVETRTWPTPYRGLVLICASQIGYSGFQVRRICGPDQWDRLIKAVSNSQITENGYGHGKAIAIGRLTDCRPMTRGDEDSCFVQYHPDLFCHFYEEVRPIKPFPWRGKPGWMTLTPEQISMIEFT